MANLVITSTANTINVVFNDMSSDTGMKKGTWRKDEISDVRLAISDAYVDIETKHEPRWLLDYTSSTDNKLVIDTINGAAPTSNSDLYDKLVELLG